MSSYPVTDLMAHMLITISFEFDIVQKKAIHSNMNRNQPAKTTIYVTVSVCELEYLSANLNN